MSQIRKAHSIEIVERRLRTLETSGELDAMELVGVHDELSRAERKWREKATGARPGGRPLSDPEAMNVRFDRLKRLVQAALRRRSDDTPERALLSAVAKQLAAREPLPT